MQEEEREHGHELDDLNVERFTEAILEVAEGEGTTLQSFTREYKELRKKMDSLHTKNALIGEVSSVLVEPKEDVEDWWTWIFGMDEEERLQKAAGRKAALLAQNPTEAAEADRKNKTDQEQREELNRHVDEVKAAMMRKERSLKLSRDYVYGFLKHKDKEKRRRARGIIYELVRDCDKPAAAAALSLGHLVWQAAQQSRDNTKDSESLYAWDDIDAWDQIKPPDEVHQLLDSGWHAYTQVDMYGDMATDSSSIHRFHSVTILKALLCVAPEYISTNLRLHTQRVVNNKAQGITARDKDSEITEQPLNIHQLLSPAVLEVLLYTLRINTSMVWQAYRGLEAGRGTALNLERRRCYVTLGEMAALDNRLAFERLLMELVHCMDRKAFKLLAQCGWPTNSIARKEVERRKERMEFDPPHDWATRIIVLKQMGRLLHWQQLEVATPLIYYMYQDSNQEVRETAERELEIALTESEIMDENLVVALKRSAGALCSVEEFKQHWLPMLDRITENRAGGARRHSRLHHLRPA